MERIKALFFVSAECHCSCVRVFVYLWMCHLQNLQFMLLPLRFLVGSFLFCFSFYIQNASLMSYTINKSCHWIYVIDFRNGEVNSAHQHFACIYNNNNNFQHTVVIVYEFTLEKHRKQNIVKMNLVKKKATTSVLEWVLSNRKLYVTAANRIQPNQLTCHFELFAWLNVNIATTTKYIWSNDTCTPSVCIMCKIRWMCRNFRLPKLSLYDGDF